MTAVEQYNALDGQVANREQLSEIATAGYQQSQYFIEKRIKKLLEKHPDTDEFQINIGTKALDVVPNECLPGMDCETPDDDFEGLAKAVSPDDIYQMITDKMLEQLKKASGKGYKKKWKKQNDEGYLLPFNFDTKKMYRGINIPMLTEGMSQVLQNPYFLTFNQIKKHKGKLKKGSEGYPVVYFTMLYKVEETTQSGEKINFGTYNKKKFLAWLDKNYKKLKFSKDYYKNTYIPILKYYNVFNGADVEGIDFKLKNFKIGYQDGSEVVKNNDPRVEIADLIIKNYPKPQPALRDSKDGRAFYRHNSIGTVDAVHMPKFEDFETGLDYYRTLLHEFTHSTGIASRLDRPMGRKFGSKPYAKEELVAEFGAVFLSAHAGIIWHNQKNHAEYLKNWNAALTHIKDDNRFIMRAASKAQEAADFILNLDKNGVPAYQNSLKSEQEKEKEKPKKPAKAKAKPVKKKRAKKKAPKAGEQLGLFGTAENKATVAFNKAILKAKVKGIHGSKVLKLGKTRGILKKHIGSFVITMPAMVIKKAMTKDEDHIAGWEHFINLPDNINKPTAIFKSKSSGFVVLTQLKNLKNKPLMVALHISKKFRVTKVASIYSRRDENSYRKWFNEGLCLYPSKKLSLNKLLPGTIPLSPVKRQNEDSKKQSVSKKKGLKSPVDPVATAPVEPVEPATNQPVPVKEPEPAPLPTPASKTNTHAKSLESAMQETADTPVFAIPGDIGRFLGKVEKKPVHSVVTTLDAEQGSGKTRFFFQVMDVLAGMGLKCLFYSLEEHPQSKLFKDKVRQYIKPENLKNISVIDEVQNWITEKPVIIENDAIFIDSFQKLPNIDLDTDIRKAFNSKLFYLIYQQNGTKGMRGGSRAAFDGDQVLKVAKHDDYRENYVYANKNRYNDAPDLKFNIYTGKLEGDPAPEPQTTEQPPTNSREPETTGFVATPVL